MSIELQRIVYNLDNSHSCMDLEKLEEYTHCVEPEELGLLQEKGAKFRYLHILGCQHYLTDDTACRFYIDTDAQWMLITNPPDVSVMSTVDLSELKELDIRFTSFADLDVSSMLGLTSLNIANNDKLHNVIGLEDLVHLTYLDIHNTNLQNIWTIADLKNLVCLKASGLYMEDARFLEKLEHLSELDLSGCTITVFPRLGSLPCLETLVLNGANIGHLLETEFPQRIHTISLAYSTIRWVPKAIRSLKQLNLLDLSGLSLEELPEWLPDLNLCFTRSGYSGIILDDTTIKGVDMSIFDQSQTVIRQWFSERNAEEKLVAQSEVKVVFLGDDGAGKSHIIARLLFDGGAPEDFDSCITPGVVVADKTYSVEDRLVKVHFWDFGGQAILHSMHRMFLTERALYVIVLNVQDNTQEEQARYWLYNIKTFATDSPAILVLNQLDQNESASIHDSDLRAIYPGMTELVKMSALYDTPEQFNTNFLGALKREIGRLDNLAASVPVSWIKIRLRLEEISADYISRRVFETLCDECGVENESGVRSSLLNWFSDLGVSFCYRDSALEDYVILRPEWITNALYLILFNESAKVRNGLISHETIYRLLRDLSDQNMENRIESIYSAKDVEYMLNVLRKFRLSFQMDSDWEFIPMLCQTDYPSIAREYIQDPNALEFRMIYDYLPVNVLHRLMVELGSNLDINNVWFFGAHFIRGSTGHSAIVTAEDNLLRIVIRAKESRYPPTVYLDQIRNVLDHINRDMGLLVGHCQVAHKLDGIVETFDYDDLLVALNIGESTITSLTGEKRISIHEILNRAKYDKDIEREKLINDILWACESLQSNKVYWMAREDYRNTYIRDLLRSKNYYVLDQTITGEAGRNISGGLDLEIRHVFDAPWTVLEALNLHGTSVSQIAYWDKHLQKLLDNCNPAGLPFLFHVSYVDASSDSFDEIMNTYEEHLRFYSPDQYELRSVETIVSNAVQAASSRHIRVFKCIYDCKSFLTTVYHFFVHLGIERIVKEKKIQMLKMPANEYKVVLLGDGEAGKSLTVARLKDPKMEPKSFDGEVTPGINIQSKSYEVDGRTVQVNFWDFGGQRVLLSMHRLFLSERALYVILLNTRNDSQDDRARFWLRYVHTYAPGAPVLLVLNKIDQNPNASLNERDLKRQYPNLKEILRISARDYDEATFKKEFLDRIEAQIKSIPAEETVFLKNGIRIRDRLRSIKDPRISRSEFRRICAEEGLTDSEGQENLLRQLNRAGVCVYFGESSDTNKQMLLKPEWITDAIYMILFNKHSSVANGVISHQEIDDLYDGIGENIRKVSDMKFSSEDTTYVLSVMRWFRLSFMLSDGNHEFIPMLCSRNETEAAAQYAQANDTLEFHFCFDYLPTDVLYQLMVSRRTELDLGNVWLTGVRFVGDNGSSAVVMSDGNIMRFLVRSDHGIQEARKYMTGIKNDVDKIISSRKLKIAERRMVYKYDGNREVFNYDRLENGETCRVSHVISISRKCAVPIRDILDQTDRSVEQHQKKMIQHVYNACKEIQENRDCYSMDEPSRNRFMRGILHNDDYFVQDQTEIGVSSTGKSAGRPDLVISEGSRSAKLIVEALNITGTSQKDLDRWDEHLKRLTVNYNIGGQKILILVTYLKCSRSKFNAISNTYYDRLRNRAPLEYGGRPDDCRILQTEESVANIHVAKADYYCDSYRPTVYHFMVYIPDEW